MKYRRSANIGFDRGNRSAHGAFQSGPVVVDLEMIRSLPVALTVLALAACTAEEAPSQRADQAAVVPAPATGVGPQATPAPGATLTGRPATRQVDASPTLCDPDERAAYNCPLDDGRVISVCLGDDAVYRFGRLGNPELEIRRTLGGPDLYQGVVVGQGGGQQTHIRFRNGAHDYVVYSGYDGRLADVPGRVYSGVSVLQDGEEISRLDCPVTSTQTEISGAMTPEDIPHETEGGDYAGWF